MIQRIFFSIFLVCFSLSTWANNANNDSIANRIFTLIYQQNLTEAEKTFTNGKDELNDFYRTFLNPICTGGNTEPLIQKKTRTNWIN